jgi:hypothetical protein
MINYIVTTVLFHFKFSSNSHIFAPENARISKFKERDSPFSGSSQPNTCLALTIAAYLHWLPGWYHIPATQQIIDKIHGQINPQ